jgi:ribosomal protein L13
MTRLREGLEQGDLKRLVHTEMHVDDFKSKLGRDEDVVVISLKVTGKEPAADIVNFVEKGYEWVIDADVSSGEMDDGDYIVFIECDREPVVAANVMALMTDLMNLTEQDISEWRVRYRNGREHELTEKNLQDMIPKTPSEYREQFGHQEIDKLKAAAGVKVTTKAPKNDVTESLRIAAGIK